MMQKRYWKKGKGQFTQTVEDLSGAEGQGSQAQARPPSPPPAERDSTFEAELGLKRVKHSIPKKYEQHKWGAAAPGTWGTPATREHPTMEEAEGGAVEVSGFSPFLWPPPNAYPLGSDLRMPTSPLPEGASAGEQELLRREVVSPIQSRGCKVQPVSRITYTSLEETLEGNTSSPFAREVRRPRGLGSPAPSCINFLPPAAWMSCGGKESKKREEPLARA